MKLLLIVFGALLLVLTACSGQNSASVGLLDCNVTSMTTDTCASGYTCYFSQIWPKGGIQGNQTGDLKCHALCETNDDCPSVTPTCKDVDMWRGDTGVAKKMCMKE